MATKSSGSPRDVVSNTATNCKTKLASQSSSPAKRLRFRIDNNAITIVQMALLMA